NVRAPTPRTDGTPARSVRPAPPRSFGRRFARKTGRPCQPPVGPPAAGAAAELWAQIRTEDWALVSASVGPSAAGWAGWPQRLWKFEKHYHHIGSTGAAGIGYGAPA